MDQALIHKSGALKNTAQLDYILLDGSGSMRPKWWDMLEAIQAYVDGLKEARVNSHLLLHIFDDSAPDYIARDVSIDAWDDLRKSPVGAYFGGTPLYDSINLMCRRLRDIDPQRCSIVIVTDGEESDSRYTDLIQAKSLLDWCRAKGWQVTFIGCDYNNSDQAGLLGGSPQSSIGVQKRLLADAARNLAKKRQRYGLYGEDMHFSEEERQQFGGYLEGPSAK